MPGIFGTNIYNNMPEKIMEEENRIYRNENINTWHLEMSSIKKFENDKIMYKDENYTVLVEGVILNLSKLKEKFNKNEMQDLIIEMYKKNGEKFFSEFRGNFCGFFEDKIKNKTIIFTNQTGDKTIFFYNVKSEIIFASEIKHIIKFMKYNDIKYNLDKKGVYCLLTYGYMYDNLTLIKEIKKLLPGHYIKIENNKIEEIEYYKLKTNIDKDVTMSEDEILEKIEKKFQEAMMLQVSKNEEYGYDNFAPLSAGLDSRMTNYMLRKIYKKDIYNITYSQTGQLDQIVPSKIASELHNHWIFKNLDNGLALYNIQKSTDITDGIIYYAWPSQLYDYMKLINTENMGIVHTGVIGDVVLATFYKSYDKKNYQIGDGAFSKTLINKLSEMITIKEYDNYEVGMLYNRAFNGAVLGYSTTFQNYTEAMSPFMNIEFMEFCFSLPLKYRFGHYIYYKWVEKYHKDAMKYAHNGVKIPKSNSVKVTIKRKKYTINMILNIIKNKLKLKTDPKSNMNPMQYWYETNKDLREKLDTYYQKNKKLLDNDNELKNDIEKLYKEGSAIEKIEVISLLSFLEKYFNKENKKDEI